MEKVSYSTSHVDPNMLTLNFKLKATLIHDFWMEMVTDHAAGDT